MNMSWALLVNRLDYLWIEYDIAMRVILTVICAFLITCGANAQSFYFGPKGGLTVGLQNWNGIERDPLLTYHGALFIESDDAETDNALFAQIGYHKRGSAEQVLFFSGSNSSFQRQPFEFNNVALQLGAKKKFGSMPSAYYGFGIRLEYTVGTNLDEYSQFGGYFPVDEFVNEFNYGASLMIGKRFMFSDLAGAFVEASISPDISKQYEQPAIANVISPFTGNTVTLREQTIRNITFELTVGFRFLRKVVYLDER